MDTIPYYRPDLSPDAKAAVLDVLDSGWLTSGAVVQRLEAKIAEHTGAQHVLAVNSATSGLQLALRQAGVRHHVQVFLPTYTFTATAEAVRAVGGTPVLVDVDAEHLNLDPVALSQKLKHQAHPGDVILPVHFAGRPCDLDTLRILADHHGMRLIEDAAHALGSHYQNQPIGIHGDATVFSLYANKPAGCGEGGLLLTPHADWAAAWRQQIQHGMDRNAHQRQAAWHYAVTGPGHKANLSDLAAAITLAELEHEAEYRSARSRIAERYQHELADLPLHLPTGAATNDRLNWHLFVIRLQPTAPCQRDALIQALQADGISCSVHYRPLHLHPWWQKQLSCEAGDFPVAEQAFTQAISLPIYPGLKTTEQTRIIERLHHWLHD